MISAVEQLQTLAREFSSMPSLPEVDWTRVKGVKTLDFQETLKARDAQAARLHSMGCVLCEHFHEHVRSNDSLRQIFLR